MAVDEGLKSPKAPPSPSSPTLLPPRKSVELEDPGAHDLDSSTEDEEVFADARDDLASPQPVPLTRVEKVDDSPRHGQVPGTEAYEKRVQDAVPDEVAIVPDGVPSMPSSRRGSQAPSRGSTPIPRTVVEKVDLESPSHGEVPGTVAYEQRKADAVPDIIATTISSQRSQPGHASSPSTDSIPRTIVTRVDSEPRYGEVPGTDAYKKRMQDAQPDIFEKDEGHQTNIFVSFRSSYFSPLSTSGFGRNVKSPIAADGGFGPMDYDGSEESEGEASDRISPTQVRAMATSFEDQTGEAPKAEEDGFGDDFDDFEDGAEGEDFGDFDAAEQASESPEPPPKSEPSVPISIPTFDIPDLSDSSLNHILSSTSAHLDSLFPSTVQDSSNPPPALPTSSSTFLTDRSLSLWSQLIAPPPLEPPNWVRSRIRRLFLVSLGVPVDLDEILPASKQKKLVLNYTASVDASGELRTPAARLRHDADAASDSSTGGRSGSKSKKRKGPPPAPEFNIAVVKALCATTTEALDGMNDKELKTHVQKLEELVVKGKEVLQYWVSRKDAAVSEKEAFDGVIENLVQHARRTRR